MPASFSNVTFDPSRIGELGGDYWYAKGPVSLAGVGTNTFNQLPIRENSKNVPSTNKTEKTSEGKRRFIITTTNYDVEIKVMQVGKAEIFTFPQEMKANDLNLFVMELTSPETLIAGTKWAYTAFLAQLAEPVGWASGESPTYKLSIVKPSQDITIALDTTTFTAFHGGAAFPASTNIIIPSAVGWGFEEV